MHAPTAAGYAAEEPTHAPPWHSLVVWDASLNALATGLFLVVAVAELARPAVFARLADWAYPIALVVLLADLTCLVLDLGSTLRFHHMLRVFKPSSPMSLGTWCLSAFSFPLTGLAALGLLTAFGVLSPDSAAVGWVRLALLVVTLPFAFGSAAYKGVLFSTSAQPGWRDARWLGAYHLASAVAMGAAGLLGLAAAAGFDRAGDALRPAAAVSIVAQTLPLALLGGELWPTLARRHSGGRLAGTVVLAVGGGVALPLVLLWVGGAAAIIAAAAATLAGCWVVRHEVVMLPHAE
jgi:hypothetical protein